MTDINVAYAVIGDERSRKEYHREWLRQKKGKTEQVSSLRKNRENRQVEAAGAALDEFFRYMVNADWERAYGCLTAVDKSKYSGRGFYQMEKRGFGMYISSAIIRCIICDVSIPASTEKQYIRRSCSSV